MCRCIKVVHFGCEERHSEVILARCRAGLEYILDMPIIEVCRGMIHVENWVMSPCRFCVEYMQAREAMKPILGLAQHRRSVSLPEAVAVGTWKDIVLRSRVSDLPVSSREGTS